MSAAFLLADSARYFLSQQHNNNIVQIQIRKIQPEIFIHLYELFLDKIYILINIHLHNR